MGLIRRNRRLTWLALCALAAQLLISFGHIHSHTVAHAEAAHVSPHVASCTLNAKSPCPTHHPVDHDEDEQHCPICWAITLAGTALLPHAPSIDLPIALAKDFERKQSVISYCGRETIKFHARAPPSTQTTI